jgi:hypothetical protein
MNDHDLITTMRESFTDVRSATAVEQIVRRSRVIRARRRIPGAVAVAAVAAAAGAAVALIPAGPAKPAPVATQRTAYVVSHVTRALDAMPSNTVLAIQRTTVPASDPMDTWTNEEGQWRLETFTLAGQPAWASGISVGSSATRVTRTTVFVDYLNKTWWRAVYYSANVKPAPATVWTCSNIEGDDIIGNYGMAAQLHTALSCGDLKVAGSGTAGGVPTVELSEFHGGVAVTYWVNATTYLPFRFTQTFSGGQARQENLQWLPATAANLAKLNVRIPAGFTQVPPRSSPSS